MKSVLLDTDAAIEIIRGNPAPVQAVPKGRLLISAITRFEILSGLRGRKATKAEARAHAFLASIEALPFDDEAAHQAADIRIHLESKGRPIGAYDLLIAGHARSLRLPLLTGNLNEFQRVPALKLLTWHPSPLSPSPERSEVPPKRDSSPSASLRVSVPPW